MEQQKQIQILDRYLAGTATETEQQHVEEWLESNATENNQWQQMDENERVLYLSSLQQKILSTINQSDVRVYKINTNIQRRRNIWRMVAAACIITVISSLVYLSFIRQESIEPFVAVASNDIKAPESNRAVITLANGKRIYLDSTGTGTLVMQPNVHIIKNEQGEVVYQKSDDTQQSEVTYNSLFNPRGSKVITIALSDGTKVWLNSESSLRYPTAFTGHTREVEIIGEAYFEVAHDAAKPFFVKKRDVNVQVLGTHFNVNAYDDERAIKVTLLEGSVRVHQTTTDNKQSIVIKPGQQTIALNGQLSTINGLDLDEVMAWKEGWFIYTNTDLSTIMRQMARWYDVELVYQDKIMDKYTVNISREVPISKLFQFIEMSGGVHFLMEGKKVIVKK
ncbi:MAG TPA: FecR domain-containing protein [Lacibacter sp.]|nr:FecR domain-containing protein [Lacibacter sp.]